VARPRTISDDAIFAAAQRAMTRLGPVKLTLADVAKDAGISPSTLVQRFGSKRGLLLAVSTAAAAGGMDACFEMLRQTTKSPLEQLIAAAMFMTQAVAAPDDVSNHLGFFLQVDLSDPDFYPHTLEMSRQMDAHYVRLAQEAVAAGELVPCDTTALARAIGAVATGSLIGWAVYRQGKAEEWVRRDIDTLVAPYRRQAGHGATRFNTGTKNRSSKRKQK
jgi:AcrR family transcriptional regulator